MPWLAKDSQRPLTTEALIRSRVRPRKIYGGKGGTGTSFPRSIFVFPFKIVPAMLFTHLHLYAPLTRNGGSTGTFQKAMHFRKSGSIECKIRPTFIFFLLARYVFSRLRFKPQPHFSPQNNANSVICCLREPCKYISRSFCHAQPSVGKL
jgi:hypothetical protein